MRFFARLFALLVAPLAFAVGGGLAAAAPTEEAIATLIAELGADDYAVRESAARRLAEMGAAPADALLAAAETSDDLEVALRARWLVQGITPTSPDDHPAAAAEMEKFVRADADARVLIMHRLLRLDDDAGIEPLARIVRLDRSPAGARTAAALLLREWRHGDPYWQGMRPRITAGLAASRRPAARFLQAVVDGTEPGSNDALRRSIDEAAAALAQLERGRSQESAADAEPEPDEAAALRVFHRCFIELLVAADRRAEAVAEAGRLFAADWKEKDDAGLTAANLIWAVERGLPEAVDCLDRRWPAFAIDDPLVAYAAAVAFRARGDGPRAETLASDADDALGESADPFAERLQAAILLVKWGADDWAIRQYEAVIDDPESPAAEFGLASIMYSEFLHDRSRDAKAAEVLEKVVTGRANGAAGEAEQALGRIGREAGTVRSRMHFFKACAAGARGDAEARRRLVEESLRHHDRDVDSLIALYQLPDNTDQQRAGARRRIERALEQLDEEIQSLPQDANGYNEYAWLVANTEGDVRKATGYSKQSLELSPDTSSYLDTLAHCHAAAGNWAAAIRTQALAHREEPHNATILRNLERFRTQAAAHDQKNRNSP